MAERQTAVDNQGNVWEYVNGQWRPQREAIGTLQAAAIGAGETFMNIGRGVADIGGFLAEGVVPGAEQFREDLRTNQASERELFGQLQQEQPIATTVGQALPFLATAPLSGGVTTQAGIGATLGALGLGDPLERAQNAAFGGAAALGGGLALSAMGRVAQGINKSAARIANRRALPGPEDFPGSVGAAQRPGAVVGTGRMSQARRLLQGAGTDVPGAGAQSQAGLEALERGKELGIMFEPGAKSGNIAARQMFASAKSSPILSDIIQEEITQANRTTFSRLALKALGEKGDEFTTATLGKIDARLSNTFEDIAKQTPVIRVTDDAIARLDDIAADVIRDPFRAGRVAPEVTAVNNVRDALQKGTITNKEYTRFRSRARSAQRKAKAAGDFARAETINEVVTVLDDMFAASTSSKNFARFQKATQQYRLLQSIDKPGVIGGDQVLRPGALGRNLTKNFKQEFARNDRFESLTPEFKDLFDATKVFNQFPEVVGDSGTATRLSLTNIFGDKVGTATQFAARPLLRSLIRSAQP